MVGLLNNVALLLVAGLVFDLFGEHSRTEKFSVRQIFTGILLGVIGLGVMLTPWELSPGLIFDARSILLSISGLFFGTLPTMIAILFTAVLRISIGGTGVWPGVAVVATSGIIGLLWRRYMRGELYDISVRELYLLGIVVHINMVLWMFTLPWPMPLKVVPAVAPWVMIIHPIGTALLGRLLVGRMGRMRAEKALLRSEHQLRVITDSLPAYVALVDLKELRYCFVNNKFVDGYKLPREKIVGSHIRDIIGEENYEFAKPYIETVRKGQPTSYENSFVTAGTKRWVNVNYVPDIGENGEADAIIVLSHDMTERRQMEEALRDNERLLRAIAANYPNSYLSVIEKDFTVGFTAGREFTKMDLDPETFVGMSLEQVFGDKTDLMRNYYQKTFAGEEQSFELFINGQHQRYNTVPLREEGGSISRILSFAENVTEQRKAELVIREANDKLREQLDEIKELEVALREQAVRDILTGLFNRRYMEETLERELSKTKRNGNVLTLVMLDLDYLKNINERYGHMAGGDEALKALSSTIQSLCRAEDTFCRYAGDEFVIILNDTPLQVAYQRVLEWQKAVADIKVNGDFKISFSAGIAEFPLHGQDGDELIQSADKALFVAKAQGRDQVVLYESDGT